MCRATARWVADVCDLEQDMSGAAPAQRHQSLRIGMIAQGCAADLAAIAAHR